MEGNLSVILIACNEEENIGRMIEGLLKNYEKEILELIVVDDCSTDKTSLIVESWIAQNRRVKLIKRTPPCGVGRALKTGFSNISPKADYALTMDSDFIKSIEEVRLLISTVEEKKYDGVIGSRFIKGSRLVAYPLGKKIMNRLFHFLVKTIFQIKQNDLTNNFKLYKGNIFRELPWQSNGYSMNAETGILPIISGYRIGEIPISWVERNAHMGKSKFRLYKGVWTYVQVILYAWCFLRRKRRGQTPSLRASQ
jgi:dolichol-phosphate mannosyltransferase